MKSMLFGLLISGKLVTCQYMLSETRSPYSFALVSFAYTVTNLQSFLRQRLYFSVRARLALHHRDLPAMLSTFKLLHIHTTTNFQGHCLSNSRCTRSVNLPFLTVLQSRSYDSNHTTFAVFTRVSKEPNPRHMRAAILPWMYDQSYQSCHYQFSRRIQKPGANMIWIETGSTQLYARYLIPSWREGRLQETGIAVGNRNYYLMNLQIFYSSSAVILIALCDISRRFPIKKLSC